MLIVIEGLDGSGKSTQVKRLRNYLQTKSGNLEYRHFPRYDSPVYGELIGKFLRGGFGSIDAVHPQLVALLYAEDRHGAAPQMWDTLNKGGIVLLDRYVYSNIAYQCAKINDETRREELREWIFDTEFGQFGLPRPDLSIFLDVPIGFVEKKLENPKTRPHLPRKSSEDVNAVNGATRTNPNEPTKVFTSSADTSVELRKSNGAVPCAANTIKRVR